MNIMAVMIYSRRGGVQDRIESKLADEKIPLLQLTDPEFGWKKRVLHTIDIARAHPCTFLIFLDAWDMLMLGTKEELLEIKGITEGITFSAQKFCWPDGSRRAEYDAKQTEAERNSAWRFINSSPMVGMGHNIATALSWGWERFPMQWNTNSCEEYWVDERFFTDLYLKAPAEMNIKIDTRCELNQNLLASVPYDLYMHRGRIYNLKHMTEPIFLHANGRTEIPPGLLI